MSDTEITSLPSPSKALNWFIVVTIIYGILVYNKKKKLNSDTSTMVYTITYLIFTIVVQFFINVSLSESYCGSGQWGSAAMITFFPWIFIFGSLILIIQIIPGWLNPFSNTFGYGFARMAGLHKLVSSGPEGILVDNNESLDTPNQKMLSDIITNRSLLINQFNTSNFKELMENFIKEGIFKDSEGNINKDKFYQLVVLKEVVAEIIWYLLAGILITSVCYNSIVNINCSKNQADMQKRREEYLKELEEAAEEENQTDQQTYVQDT